MLGLIISCRYWIGIVERRVWKRADFIQNVNESVAAGHALSHGVRHQHDCYYAQAAQAILIMGQTS
jgi:hypothetical protein